MKRIILLFAVLAVCVGGAKAQKFALIDMEYILKNIPAYEMANEQLKQISLRWEKEITEQAQKVEDMYKEYQSNAVFLPRRKSNRKKRRFWHRIKPLRICACKYFGP